MLSTRELRMPRGRLIPTHWLVLAAAAFFVGMGLFVKLASTHYTTAEIVMYRGLFGLLAMVATSRISGASLRTQIPLQHVLRSVCGVTSLMCWFYALGELPLATAMSLNHMSSVWVAVLLLGGSQLFGTSRIDGRLVWVVVAGFGGVLLMLQPTFDHERWLAGLIGLISGLATAVSYLQIGALGRAGEPSFRIVFYFSLGSVLAGGTAAVFTGFSSHSLETMVPLLGVGFCATIAQQLMTMAYSKGNALVNASVQYTGVAFSFTCSVLLLNEHFSLQGIAGMSIVAVACVFASKWTARPAQPENGSSQKTFTPR
jgi:drug/metabolite transporter (DMT)-like permease